MAIFKFNETSFKLRQKLKMRDFFCHLELETYTGHHFHVYIDEMNLDNSDVGCKDSLQGPILLNFSSSNGA